MRSALGILLVVGVAAAAACGTGSSDDLFGNAGAVASSSAATGAGGTTGATSSVGMATSTVSTTSVATTTGGETTAVTTGSDVTTGSNTTTSTSGQGGGPASVTVGTTANTSGAGGGADPIGCSDGTREYFADLQGQPDIAGCDGGFQVAGVTTPESFTPQCGRIAGNTSANADGVGCSVEDLCSEGWHVCHGAIDVAASSSNGQCEPFLGNDQVFYITRQVQDANGNCTQPPDANNITGCGTLGGLPVGINCAPLDRRMRIYECIPTAAWYCGNNDQVDGTIEAQIVLKVNAKEGGVLCCRD